MSFDDLHTEAVKLAALVVRGTDHHSATTERVKKGKFRF